MNGHVPFLQCEGVGFLVIKENDILRPAAYGAGQLALRIVITLDDVDRNAGVAESDCLLDKEQARSGIRPIAIPEIAGDQHEGDALIDGELDKILEGFACGGLDASDGSAFKSHQSA